MTTPRDIITAVCRAFGVEYGVLVNTRNRTAPVVEARDAAVWLMRTHTRMSYPEIAAALARSPRAHSGAKERYDRAAKRMETDEAFARRIRYLERPELAYRDRFLAGAEDIPAELDGDALRMAVACEVERHGLAVAREAI